MKYFSNILGREGIHIATSKSTLSVVPGTDKNGRIIRMGADIFKFDKSVRPSDWGKTMSKINTKSRWKVL